MMNITFYRDGHAVAVLNTNDPLIARKWATNPPFSIDFYISSAQIDTRSGITVARYTIKMSYDEQCGWHYKGVRV